MSWPTRCQPGGAANAPAAIVNHLTSPIHPWMGQGLNEHLRAGRNVPKLHCDVAAPAAAHAVQAKGFRGRVFLLWRRSGRRRLTHRHYSIECFVSDSSLLTSRPTGLLPGLHQTPIHPAVSIRHAVLCCARGCRHLLWQAAAGQQPTVASRLSYLAVANSSDGSPRIALSCRHTPSVLSGVDALSPSGRS